MKIVLILGFFLFSVTMVNGQNQKPSSAKSKLDRYDVLIRPNSRDYTMVRKGNEHQRMLRLRTHDIMLRRQALLNRKQAMDRRREMMQQRMMRQQQNRQRMIHQRNIHR
jgi:hypothetical protein